MGFASTFTETVLVEEGHAPLEIVHMKTFEPALKPVTPELFEVGEVILAPPETTLQEAVPTEGTLADRVAVEAQIFWLVPAFDAVGVI